jgi:SAM-dependent methyltransferase
MFRTDINANKDLINMAYIFKFPDPKKRNKFIFFNNGFLNKKRILEYNENLEGWTEDHTSLHEDISNGNHPIDIFSRSNLIKNISNNIKKKTILEIGCSSGYLIKDLKAKFKYINYVGADVLKLSLLKLSEKWKEVPFLKFDITKNPLKNIKFDNIIMLNVLEHINDDFLAIKNTFKLLNKNGLIYIEVPAHQFLYDNYDKQLFHFRRYSIANLEQKLVKAGYTIIKKQHLGFFCFIPFAITKIINKLFSKNKNSIKNKIKISNNLLVKFLFYIEEKFPNFYYPFGIRCFVIAKKM